jgi:mono/diheme cytochrome c family protein
LSLVLLLFAFLFGILGFNSGSQGTGAVEPQRFTVPVPGPKHHKDPRVVRGARIFAESGCLNCHTYAGRGSSNLGAPDLTREGDKGRGVRFQIAYLRCPSCTSPGSAMPPFTALGARKLRLLVLFLEASKGPA